MRLKKINIKRFRSIENLEINDCGAFNVLIGKNNTGKSNILTAIQAFFSYITPDRIGTLASLNLIGKTVDFYGKAKTLSPIEIALTFLLTLTERDSLVQDIIADAPQMRNALEGIDPSLHMTITLTIKPPPPPTLGFISKIVIAGTSEKNERTLLSINAEAALELQDQLIQESAYRKSLESLLLAQSRERDEWRFNFQPETGRASPSRSFRSWLQRRISLPADMTDIILRQIPDSPSFEEFTTHLQNLISKMQEELSTLHKTPLKNKVNTFAGEEASVPPYVFNILRKISDIKVFYLKELRKQIGKDEAARLLSLKTRRRGPEVLRNIQETVSSLLGVKIDAFESDTVVSDGKPVAELDVDDFLVEVNGSGVREALRLILDTEFEQPHILLLEEPEIHLHPALETSMMRYLKNTSKERQIFLTTHSTNFLDTAEMKNVYLVSKPKSTQVQLMDFEEAETQIPRELGIRLSSLFMFDRLVFVEGPSDAAIIREWAFLLGVNLNQVNTGFITMGGARNIMHYAAEGTLSFLKKRQVKLWFLIDKDERLEPEITKIEKDLGRKANICVLRRREIENYLICVRALVRFIEDKRYAAGNKKEVEKSEITESDVRSSLEECAEKLKQVTIDKRVARLLCKPAYYSFDWLFGEGQDTSITEKITHENQRIVKNLEEITYKAQKVYEEQCDEVNKIWSSQKLNLVPGDHLLDMTCKKYGVRFKKEVDGPRLAALMKSEEIDEEVQRIITQIGNISL